MRLTTTLLVPPLGLGLLLAGCGARPAPADAAAPAPVKAHAPDARPEKDATSSLAPRDEIEAVLIPLANLPDDFVEQRWRTTSLGACSALVDGSTSGYTLHGSVGQPGDARLRAVLTGGDQQAPTLFVEVSDDRFVGPGRSWVTDDHLELWLGDATPKSPRICGKQSAEWSAQWGIRVADGAVFPAHGAPTPLAGVERVIAGHTARFKIPLPERRGGRLTVVYSDSDDGRRQKSLIGTSELRFGDPATMGESFPTNVACTVKRGALQPKPVLLEPSLTEAATEHLFDAAEGE
jgi:hypothetical protein